MYPTPTTLNKQENTIYIYKNMANLIRKAKRSSSSKSKCRFDAHSNSQSRANTTIPVEDGGGGDEEQRQHVPFERLESPRPPSLYEEGDNSVDRLCDELEFIDRGNDSGHDDDDEPEPFASLDCDYDFEESDHTEKNGEEDEGEGNKSGIDEEEEDHLRPPSQNSIASVIKNSIQEAKQMMNLCGVGVGNHHEYNRDPNDVGAIGGSMADFYHRDAGFHLTTKFYEESYSSGPYPLYEDSIPSRTQTASSSSLSTHFDKHRQVYEGYSHGQGCGHGHEHEHDNSNKSSGKNHNHQDQGKQVPFPLSVYPSSTATTNNQNQNIQNPSNNNNKSIEFHHHPEGNITTNAIPLRHSQSVPFGTTTAEPVPRLFMRRSASTPATFKIGKGRSAFGKVQGITNGSCSSSFRSRTRTNTFSSRAPDSKNAPATVPGISMSDGKHRQPRRSNSASNIHVAEPGVIIGTGSGLVGKGSAVEFNPITLPTPTKKWLSAQPSTSSNLSSAAPKPEVKLATTSTTSTTNSKLSSTSNPAVSIVNYKDSISVASLSNDDVSSVTSSTIYSKSQIMDSKAQRRIKDRRKERRKLQREGVPESSISSGVNNGKKEVQNKISFQTSWEEEGEGASLGRKNSNGTKLVVDAKASERQKVEKLQDEFARLHCKGDAVEEKGNVSYLSLESENDPTGADEEEDNHRVIGRASPVPFACTFPEKNVPKPLSRKVESPTPIPQPAYQKILDDDQPSPCYLSSNPPLPLPHNRRSSKTPASPIGRVATPPSNHTQIQMSPCSHDSASFSRTTSRSGQSNNTSALSTSLSGNVSCNRSVTSSVAEADREVRDTNRRELRRREGVDLDGSMSIQSSDTTSTNAYLALTSSPAQLREGANIPYDRFFGCNNSIGPVNSQSSNASSVGWTNMNGQHSSSPGVNGRNSSSMNVRSPITVSSNSIANNTNSSASTGEDPPRFVSCSSKVVPINSNRGYMPPRSDHHDSSTMGYSKLDSSDCGKGKSSSSSRSSSSKSSKSKSSRSKKKDKPTRLYHKIGSAKVADQSTRASTPSPCNSFQLSPVKTPMTPPNQFDYPFEPIDVPKPRAVHRQFPGGNIIPGSKMVLVSPNDNERRRDLVSRPMVQSLWPPNSRDHRAFQPTAIPESVVTPEKEECI